MNRRWDSHCGAVAKDRKLAKAALGMLLCCAAFSASADGSGKWKDGKEAYDKVCAYCHETGVGPEIRSRNAPKEWTSIVRNGDRAMPPFRRSEIDDATLIKLMEYIK